MSKGINKFLDMMKLSEPEDDYDEDDYDEEEEEQEEPARPIFGRRPKEKAVGDDTSSQPISYDEKKRARTQAAGRQAGSSSNGKLIPLNNSRNAEVYVMRPDAFNEAQIVADFLNEGKTVVINMEGIEIYQAQRIVDFISGACYAINGTLQAVSNNIFIAAPEAIEVNGDFRKEILNDNMLAPDLGKYRV